MCVQILLNKIIEQETKNDGWKDDDLKKKEELGTKPIVTINKD